MSYSRHAQWKLLDNYRRQMFIRHELKRLVLRSLIRANKLPLGSRYVASLHFSSLPLKSSSTKSRNRCVTSGRKWNVLSKVQYSRFVFRFEAYKGHLPGVKRLSW